MVGPRPKIGRRRDEAQKLAPGIRTFDDHRKLLETEMDGVIVASPLHLHARHFLDTIAAGKDLYCEKTMTWSIPEADKCFAAAKSSNRIVQIGLQHESSGALVDAKQWIKDGWVGKVTHVESWMSRNTPHGKGQWVRPVPSDCTPDNVDWKAFLNGRPDRPFDGYKLINWRLFWEFSGGNCAENMVHQIAWIMSALDLPEPSAAYMSGGVFSEKDGREVPDTIAVTLDLPKDIVVTWQSTFSNKHYELGDRFLGSDRPHPTDGELGGGGGAFPLISVAIQSGGGVDRGGARLLDLQRDVRHAVLERLELADGYAELLPGAQIIERFALQHIHHAHRFPRQRNDPRRDGILDE